MAKTSFVHTSTAESNGAFISREARRLINSTFSPPLRTVAAHFITEVKKQFDPLAQRKESYWSSMAADKFAHIAREYSQKRNPEGLYKDSRAFNMFHSPAFFPKGTWQTLTNQDRQKVISVGLQVAGSTILQRNKADNSREFRTSLLASDRNPTSVTKHRRVPSSTTAANTKNRTPGHSSGKVDSGHSPLNTEMTPPMKVDANLISPVAADYSPATHEAYRFDPRILSKPIRAIPWPEDQLIDALDARGLPVVTLLDLVNLPARELFFTLRAANLPHNKFNSWLEAIEDDQGLSLGKTLSLLFAPLGSGQGGLRLSTETVSSLHDVSVAPSRLEKGLVITSTEPHTLRIDSGWRLLRHYKHSEMKILSPRELRSMYKKFLEAGFASE